MWLLIGIVLVAVPPRWLFTAPWCDPALAPGTLVPAPVSVIPEAVASRPATGHTRAGPHGLQAGPLLCSKRLVVGSGGRCPGEGHFLAGGSVWLVALAVERLPLMLR